MKSIVLLFLCVYSSNLFGQAVGIGTTTPDPAFKLDVNGPITTSGLRTLGASNYISIFDQANTNNFFRWNSNTGYSRFSYNTVSPSTNKDLLIIQNDGKLGIGTVNPTTWLDLNNTTGFQLARFNGGNQMWITLAENGLNRGYLGSYAGNAEDVELGTYGSNTTGKVHLTTGNLPRLSVDGNGNVGIGVLPSAGNRLSILGGDLLVKENGDISRIQMDSDQSNSMDFFIDGVQKHKVTSSSTEFVLSRSGGTVFSNKDIKINSIGNVGINASAGDPVSKLQVYGSADASYTTHGVMVLGFETGANVVYDQNEILARDGAAAADLFIQKDGGHLLLCGDEQGAVGIGVGSAASMPAGSLLAVDGKITCEEVLVKMSQNWPDYVFADDYKLPDLKDVKSFIDKNKHLPGIPRAIDIEKEGLALGEVQRKMMEKIEELTLYVIKLQEEIGVLKKQ